MELSMDDSDADFKWRKEVTEALEQWFPTCLAESWDNVGLLMQPVMSSLVDKVPHETKVLVTNDLTEAVMKEALMGKCGMIVTYHPLPFRGLKKVTLNDSVAAMIVSTCLRHDVWVYSPHTACDNAYAGVNDWLCEACSNFNEKGRPIVPIESMEGAGRGRIVELSGPIPLIDLVERLKKNLGVPTLRVAPGNKSMQTKRTTESVKSACQTAMVQTIAVQAGSGAQVLAGVKADVFVTGEMSHHEVLAANAADVSVILAEHSNSERGFLKQLAGRLEKAFPHVQFNISKIDADPLHVL